jgi:hypothetical protein
MSNLALSALSRRSAHAENLNDRDENISMRYVSVIFSPLLVTSMSRNEHIANLF